MTKIRAMALAAASLTLILLSGLSGADAAVTLKRAASVEGPVVLLADLFAGLNLRKAQTPIARAPQPGHSVVLDARWLAAVAKAQGLDWRPASMLDQVTLERASRTIEPATVEAAVRAALAQQGVPETAEIGFDFALPQLRLALGAGSGLRVANLTYDTRSGRFAAEVVAPAEGKVQDRAQILGSAIDMVEVPILARRMTSDEVIGAEDIAWERRRSSRVARNTILDHNALIGMSPRRVLRVGQMVREGDLRRPIAVAKNSIVTIRLATALMVLTVQGRALEDGALGEAIRVQNTTSNRTITAAVRGPDLVEIIPPSLAAAQLN